jgi:hypothetical protein
MLSSYSKPIVNGSDSITDISVIKIAECCPDLNVLIVASCTNITDISMLKVFDCCHHLNYLNMHGCSNITDLSKNKFRSKRIKVI